MCVCVVPRVNKGAKACTQYVMVLQRGCKVNHAAITQVSIMVEMVIYWFITSFIANISNILQFMLCKSWHVKTNKLCVGLTGLFLSVQNQKTQWKFFSWLLTHITRVNFKIISRNTFEDPKKNSDKMCKNVQIFRKYSRRVKKTSLIPEDCLVKLFISVIISLFRCQLLVTKYHSFQTSRNSLFLKRNRVTIYQWALCYTTIKYDEWQMTTYATTCCVHINRLEQTEQQKYWH